jgi:ABC-type uncharacterized transport system substrate-binding protein
MKPLARTALLLSALAAPAVCGAARLSVVVADAKPSTRTILDALRRDLAPDHQVRVFDLRSVNLSDPVVKGRFLAQVSDTDAVISVGDPATRIVSGELEDLRTFFVSAATVKGDFLSQPRVAGILSYSSEETVRAAKTLIPALKSIGVLYTPGYEDVLSGMKASAQQAGVALDAYRVTARADVGPSARRAAERDDLLWIVGDPLLTQDLIFSYLLQQSLSLKKPLAAPLPALVGKGALFCTVPDDQRTAAMASSLVGRFLSARDALPAGERLRTAPPGGVVVNRGLAAMWGLRVPPSFRAWDEANGP